jgi:hypothetical protein
MGDLLIKCTTQEISLNFSYINLARSWPFQGTECVHLHDSVLMTIEHAKPVNDRCVELLRGIVHADCLFTTHDQMMIIDPAGGILCTERGIIASTLSLYIHISMIPPSVDCLFLTAERTAQREQLAPNTHTQFRQ